jgi:hypothetical protein
MKFWAGWSGLRAGVADESVERYADQAAERAA